MPISSVPKRLMAALGDFHIRRVGLAVCAKGIGTKVCFIMPAVLLFVLRIASLGLPTC